MDLKNNDAEDKGFLKKLSWDNCVLNVDQKRQLEIFLVENHDMFAKHRFDVGYNTELKTKLTPEHPLPVYVQSPPALFHLRFAILVGLALLRFFNVVSTLSQSRYRSPFFFTANCQANSALFLI